MPPSADPCLTFECVYQSVATNKFDADGFHIVRRCAVSEQVQFPSPDLATPPASSYLDRTPAHMVREAIMAARIATTSYRVSTKSTL